MNGANRACVMCGRPHIRSIEQIGEELYLAPIRIAQSTASLEMRWITLECQARRLADEIRGVCSGCHADMNTAASRAALSRGG